jgi:hypothetical protein
MGENRMKDREICRLRAEITKLNEKLRAKNVALDAMAWVWCDGGCATGVYRRVDMELTEEIVRRAERNTERLRRWMNNKEFKKRWGIMSPEQRSEWLTNSEHSLTLPKGGIRNGPE